MSNEVTESLSDDCPDDCVEHETCRTKSPSDPEKELTDFIHFLRQKPKPTIDEIEARIEGAKALRIRNLQDRIRDLEQENRELRADIKTYLDINSDLETELQKPAKQRTCYCDIGAGGNPCVSREHCDRRRYDYGNRIAELETEVRRLNSIAEDCMPEDIKNIMSEEFDPVAFICCGYLNTRAELKQLRDENRRLSKRAFVAENALRGSLEQNAAYEREWRPFIKRLVFKDDIPGALQIASELMLDTIPETEE